MRVREIVSIILLILGFGGVIGSFWLVWDWTNSLSRFLNWNKFWKEWCFWLPYFVECIHANRWTLVYDIALGWAVLSLFLLAVGCYYLGKFKE